MPERIPSYVSVRNEGVRVWEGSGGEGGAVLNGVEHLLQKWYSVGCLIEGGQLIKEIRYGKTTAREIRILGLEILILWKI